MNTDDLVKQITYHVEQIRKIQELRLKVIQTTVIPHVYVDNVRGFEYAQPMPDIDSQEMSRDELKHRNELMRLFASLFYGLNMTNEWAALTLAMDIMRRQNTNEHR